MKKINQNKSPNFIGKEGELYLVRCFACGGKYGTENYAPAVATGICAFCGWTSKKEKSK